MQHYTTLEMPEPPDARAPPPPAAPRGRPARNAPASRLSTVIDAVRTFLADEFEAREVRVTRIAALAGADGGWEAEAEILVPDLAIKTLGLPLTQEVLERRTYAVLVDPSLAIRGYEPLDHGG
jgi:hypothetical protein